MKDPRKAKAMQRAQAIYARHTTRADASEVFLVGPPIAAKTIEDQLIEAIAIAIYDAATTGQV